MAPQTQIKKPLRQIVREQLVNKPQNYIGVPLDAYGKKGTSATTLVLDENSALLVSVFDKWIWVRDFQGLPRQQIGEETVMCSVDEILAMSDIVEIRDYLLQKRYGGEYTDADAERFYWRLCEISPADRSFLGRTLLFPAGRFRAS